MILQAYYGKSELDSVNIQDNIKIGQIISKHTDLNKSFGDVCVNTIKYIYIKWKIEMIQECLKLDSDVIFKKRIGFKNIQYDLDIPNVYKYKLLEHDFELLNINCIDINNEKIDGINENDIILQNKNYFETNLFKNINEKYDNKIKEIDIIYSRSAIYEIYAYELGGFLYKDIVIGIELPLYKKNWICHFFPKYNHYLYNLHIKYMKLFINKFDNVIISIASEKKNDDFQLKEEFKEFDNIIYLSVSNNKHIGEGISFQNLLNNLDKNNDKEYTFYSHSKGFSRYNSLELIAISSWIELMYFYNLINMDIIFEKNYIFGGVFTTRDRIENQYIPQWHYSGSFYWFNNKIVLNQLLKTIRKNDYYISEKFPGITHPHINDKILCILSDTTGYILYNQKSFEKYENILYFIKKNIK